MTRANLAKMVVIAAVMASVATQAASACGASWRASVAGPVLDVPEAGVICVALGPRPEQWVRVRLASAETLDRKRLMAAAFSRRVDCALIADGWFCHLGPDDLAILAGSRETTLTAANWS